MGSLIEELRRREAAARRAAQPDPQHVLLPVGIDPDRDAALHDRSLPEAAGRARSPAGSWRPRRGRSQDTALRLSRYFGTSERFWLNLQARYDLEIEKDRLGAALEDIRPLSAAS